MTKPRISLIAAMDENNCIGVSGDLPFRISADLKRFKALTMGKPMIMGRKTFDSLGGKPLPGRLHIVISRQAHDNTHDNVVYKTSMEEALEAANKESAEEIMIIGGGQIFGLALPMADRLYMTEVKTKVPLCDAVFPAINQKKWKLAEKELGYDEKTRLSYIYKTYDRV